MEEHSDADEKRTKRSWVSRDKDTTYMEGGMAEHKFKQVSG